MNRDWVEENLRSLGGRLSPPIRVEETREFEPTSDLYDGLFRAGDFAYFVRLLCDHVQLPTAPEIEIVGDSDVPVLDLQAGLRFFGKQMDSAGDYEGKPLSIPRIRVGASYLRRPRLLAKICAHELGHHLLRTKWASMPTGRDAEMLTDLTSVFFGFGKLMLNGAAQPEEQSVLEPVHLSAEGMAYLGYPLLSYAYYICQCARGVTGRHLYRLLEDPCVEMVRAFAYHQPGGRSWWLRLWDLLFVPPELPQTDGTRIVDGAWRLDESKRWIFACPKCGVRLRIPRSDKQVNVKCTQCDHRFVVTPRHL